MSRRRARYLAQRQALLELEAEVQRASLAATFAKWEQRRVLNWAAESGRALLHVARSPRVRWLIATAAVRLLKRKA